MLRHLVAYLQALGPCPQCPFLYTRSRIETLHFQIHTLQGNFCCDDQNHVWVAITHRNNLDYHQNNASTWLSILSLLLFPQPLGNFLSFLEASIAFEGMGRPRGFRRLRKTHLENILPRGSRDRDPRYPKGVPWDQNFFLKNFLLKSYLGICRQVWGLL